MNFLKMSGWTLLFASFSANAQTVSANAQSAFKCMVGFNMNRSGSGLTGAGSSPINPIGVGSEKECEAEAIKFFLANKSQACTQLYQGNPPAGYVSGYVRMTFHTSKEVIVAALGGSCPSVEIKALSYPPTVIPPFVTPPIVQPPITPPDRLSVLEASDKKQNLQISNLNSTVLSLRNQVGTQQLLIDSLTKRMVEVEKRLGIGVQQSFVINSISVGALDPQRIYFKGMIDSATAGYVEIAFADNVTVFKQCELAVRSANSSRTPIKVTGIVSSKVQSGSMTQIYIKKVTACSAVQSVGRVALLPGTIEINGDGTTFWTIHGYDKSKVHVQLNLSLKNSKEVLDRCILESKKAVSSKLGLIVTGTPKMHGDTMLFEDVITGCEVDQRVGI